MHRAKPQPIRNKIDLADPAHTRAWTKRLGITSDDLGRIVGNSVAAVTKEIELRKASTPRKPALPAQLDPATLPAVEAAVADAQLAATAS